MPDVQLTLQSKVIDLASEALTSFCEDVSGMFGVEMSCEQVSVHENACEEIKKHFKKLGAVYSVQVSGALNDDLRILVDRAGLFTLTGVVAMLPKSRILSSAKRGTLAGATEIPDAVGEVGKLLIGSWDLVFREGFKDHTHSLHTGTFVGDPCAEDNGVIDLASDEEVAFVSYKMSVGEYPAFHCGVYLPSRLFAESQSISEFDAQDVVVPEAQDDSLSEQEAPVGSVGPVAETSELAEPQEAPVQTDEAYVEAVPVAGDDSGLMAGQSVSANPGPNLLAKHLMETQVHWASVDDTVHQAQTKMQGTGASYLLVGDGSRLEGVVTRSDLDSAASIYLRPIFSKWRRPEDDATLQIRLKWIMSKQVYSVEPETPLFNVVHLKCKYDISCLPVVDVQGQVLGVVTTRDVLKGLVNKDLTGMGPAVAQSSHGIE